MIPFPEELGGWGCRVNAHRHGWNGDVCSDAATWSCGANDDFRRDFCASGHSRCYHIWLFDDHSPHFVIESKGGWLFEDEEKAWNNQVLLLYTSKTAEPQGMIGPREQRVAGFYVVDHVEPIAIGQSTGWRIFPKAWRSMGDVIIDVPYYQRLPRPYLVQFPAASIRRVLSTWDLRATSNRDKAFIEKLKGEYLPAAHKQNLELARKYGFRPPEKARLIYTEKEGFANNAFGDKLREMPVPVQLRPRDITRVKKLDQPNSASETSETTTKATEARPAAPTKNVPSEPVLLDDAAILAPLLDDETTARLRDEYEDDIIDALLVGSARPNGLVIFRGEPGVGKSHLATSLVPKNRQHVVPVVSTWRGSEDLLGYPNPMTSKFVPTPFAEFLRKASEAWEQDDQDPFLVVFEEFNLSPPEYWLSDILVRSQYPVDRVDLRSLQLPGAPPNEHWKGTEDHVNLFLSPAVRFVATVNNDHTTRPLSPRVLDRATLVLVDAPIAMLLDRAGVPKLDAKQLEAISTLVEELRPFGAHFSQRSALALRDGFYVGRQRKWRAWQVVDLVLLTHVLSAVRVYAQDDPDQIRKLEDLAERWDDAYQGNLPRCYAQLENWLDRLHGGHDVVQA